MHDGAWPAPSTQQQPKHRLKHNSHISSALPFSAASHRSAVQIAAGAVQQHGIQAGREAVKGAVDNLQQAVESH